MILKNQRSQKEWFLRIKVRIKCWFLRINIKSHKMILKNQSSLKCWFLRIKVRMMLILKNRIFCELWFLRITIRNSHRNTCTRDHAWPNCARLWKKRIVLISWTTKFASKTNYFIIPDFWFHSDCVKNSYIFLPFTLYVVNTNQSWKIYISI